ncbi:MAG: MFS transporter [Pseudomonadota bacterium]|nr:MFS transporter [Pseudomonadota bacterium]
MARRNVSAALATTLVAQTFGSAAVLAPTVLAPLIGKSMDLSVTTIGLYISIVYVGSMIASVLSGPVIDAAGGTRVSQIALLICAVGLCLLSTSVVILAVWGAFMIGLGYGPLTPASSDVLARAAPPGRMAVIYSLKQTGVPLGGVLAGLLLPVLALAIGWNWALTVVGGGCALCAVAATPYRLPLDGERSGKIQRPRIRQALEPIASTLRNTELKILAISSGVFSATQFCLAVYLVTFLTQTLLWQIVAAGVALSATQATGAFARVFWGWVADRGAGAKRTLIVLAAAMAASALSTLVLDDTTPPLMVVALMVIFGATAGGWNGVYLATVARLAPPGQIAKVTGGTLAFTYLGIVIGPLLFGTVADWTGSFAVAFGALAIPLSLCVVQLLWLKIDRPLAQL